MSEVYVAGVGQTKFGELWEQDLRDLGLNAAKQALADARQEISAVDAILVANMNAGIFSGQEHLGALFAAELRTNVPAFHIEGACASGGLAINLAWTMLASGQYQNILVIGAEKMTDVDGAEATRGLNSAADEEWEGFYGVTFPSLYAMIAREHMRLYGTTREDLAAVSVKNHANALLNPDAQFRKAISVAAVLEATPVAEPLGLLDCSPISDGAAAVILSTRKPKNSSKHSVRILASNVAQSSLSLHNRQEISTIDATITAAQMAYKAAKLKAADIDIAEVHDCFTIAEILAYEDLGFAKKGQGVDLIRSGATNRDGKLPVNVSGGLKACGHPVGATGVKQIVELTKQLQGRAGERQVQKQLKHALAHNVGGSGATAVVTILALDNIDT